MVQKCLLHSKLKTWAVSEITSYLLYSILHLPSATLFGCLNAIFMNISTVYNPQILHNGTKKVVSMLRSLLSRYENYHHMTLQLMVTTQNDGSLEDIL